MTAENDRKEPALEETLDDLGWGDLRILQPKKGNRFSLDAVLLAHFVRQEQALEILDIGTGNGILPLLLTHFKPKANIDGIEIQPQLAARARRNMALNRVESRVKIYQGDARDSSQPIYQKAYGLIISNPPFFKLGEGYVSSCPELAISRHELTLTLEDLLTLAGRLLAPEGRLAVIYRIERLEEMLQALARNHLTPVKLRLIQSFSGQPARLFLLSCGVEEAPPLEKMPPLIIYKALNAYTDEICEMMRPDH